MCVCILDHGVHAVDNDGWFDLLRNARHDIRKRDNMRLDQHVLRIENGSLNRHN